MTSMAKVNQFRDERHWRPYHTEKDLALSVMLEAVELLEIFQWDSDENAMKRIDDIQDELADVLIYSYMMIDNLNLDVDALVERKLHKVNVKYPNEIASQSGLEWTPTMTAVEKVVYFRQVRGWDKGNEGCRLAISVTVEAAELLEHFQWKNSIEALSDMDDIMDELADVLIYCFAFVDFMDFELDALIDRKLKKNAIKYPI